MEKNIAKVISILCHPLLIPTYAIIILMNLHAYFTLIIPGDAKLRIVALVFIFTFVFPAVVSVFMLRIKMIRSLLMETKEERIFPFLVTIVFFYLAYHFLKGLQLAPVFYLFMLGATLLVIIALFINFFWKISIHMLAWGGMFGAFLALSLMFMIDIPVTIFAIIIVSGLVGYSRLRMETHHPAQVYSGFLAGAIIMLSLFLFV